VKVLLTQSALEVVTSRSSSWLFRLLCDAVSSFEAFQRLVRYSSVVGDWLFGGGGEEIIAASVKVDNISPFR
jgi:hypothetical protein